MLTASNFDENVVFAVFNSQRQGDFKPYLLKSNDKGKTWVSIASNLPERSYPQQLWTLSVTRGNQVALGGDINLTANWLGEPLVCVLNTVIVKKNDDADTIIRYLPNGGSSVTLLGLVFTEFETGTYVPFANATWSKSEISTNAFGPSG
jgi:hypothetical protein